MTYINVLSISDIAFVSDPSEFPPAASRHRPQPDLETRNRGARTAGGAQWLIKRYGFRRLLRAEYGFRRLLGGKDEALTMYVLRSISQAKRPPIT